MDYASKAAPSGRTTGIVGIAAILLIMAGFGMMTSNGLNVDPAAPESAFAELAARKIPAAATAGLFLDVVGSVLFLVFGVLLWAYLRQSETSPAGPSMLVLAGAIVASAAAAGDKAAFYAVAMRSGRGLDAAEAEVLFGLIGGFFLLFRVFSGLMAGAAAVSALRTRALPRWTAWLGLVAAASSALAAAGPGLAVSQATFMLFPLWMLSVGVSLLRRRQTAIDGRRTAPAV